MLNIDNRAVSANFVANLAKTDYRERRRDKGVLGRSERSFKTFESSGQTGETSPQAVLRRGDASPKPFQRAQTVPNFPNLRNRLEALSENL